MERYRRSNKLANFSCAMILLMAMGALLNPLGGVVGKVQATVSEDLGNTSTIAMSIFNSDGIELGDNVTQTVNAELGEVAYINNTVRLTANRLKQYYVDVQAVPGANGNLVGIEHGDSIGGVGTGVLPANFRDNTWGVALTSNMATPNASLQYSTLPMVGETNRVQYQSGVNPTNGTKDVKLTFAAKITDAKPADSYQTNVMVSVVAEPEAVFGGITTMQEMTASACSSARENDTIRLRDTRDDKYYWVAKLKDGNCWMMQNLALDLTGKTLTPENSDVTSNWAGGSSVVSEMWSTQTANQIKYYNPGEYVPLFSTPGCGATSVDSLAGCPGSPWKNVNGMVASNKTPLGAIIVGNTYDAHYLAGNYYSWVAAKAGSTNTSPDTSICPSGWRLPPLYGTKSYTSLATSYGTKGSDHMTYGDLLIVNAPLYFVLSGNVDKGALWYVGTDGIYWSSVSRDGSYAYSFLINGNEFAQTDYNARYSGHPVRCVAK